MYKLVTLYHGSKFGIKGNIRKDASSSKTDFGAGFYTGEFKSQALARIYDRNEGEILELSVDLDKLHVYYFTDYMDWALYIAYNRGYIFNITKYKKLEHLISYINSFDVVCGLIADDRMLDILQEFFNRSITDMALIEGLSFVNLGRQFVFKTDKACDELVIKRKFKPNRSEVVTSWQIYEKSVQEYKRKMNEIMDKYDEYGSRLPSILRRYQ